MTTASDRKRIGNMNGPWALMLKLMLATYPPMVAALLAWGSWVTVQTVVTAQFRASGERFTSRDGAALRRDLEGEISDHKIDSAKIETMLLEIKSRLANIEQKLDRVQ